MSKNNLANLEVQLEQFCENIRQIGVIVSDFQPQGQVALNQKIQSLITDLQMIDKSKNVGDIRIDLAVFDYIDKGKNPQLYTKHCLENALRKNEETKGKIDSYRKFHRRLLLDLQKEFPNETNMFRAVRQED